MTGVSVGPYKILKKLGSGGQGEVFLAEDTRLRRKVALKTLSEAWAKPSSGRHHLLHEARMAARLNNPHIAAIYDVIEAEDQAHIVMEYVEGESLAVRLSQGPTPVEEVLKVGIQIADALSEAHAHNVIHRDLKPANLILTRGANIKVLDFGLAKRVEREREVESHDKSDDSSTAGGEGMFVGTPAYMSPEQVLGEKVDGRSDIYSLGVVLFELLTGQKAFRSTDSMGLSRAILIEATPHVSRFNPDVPERLGAIVARCMEREPSKRYRTADELKTDLHQLLQNEDEVETIRTPRPAPPFALMPKKIRGWPGKSALAAMALIPLVVIGIFVGRWWSDSKNSAPIINLGGKPVLTVLPFRNIGGKTQNDSICETLAYMLNTAMVSASGLMVVPPPTEPSYRYANRDPKKISRELGVNLIVDAGMRQDEKEFEVMVSLYRADSGAIVWGNAYPGEIGSEFKLIPLIAAGLFKALGLTLTEEEWAKLGRSTTQSKPAFDDYTRGRSYLERTDIPENIDRAIEYFKSAVAKDPQFALAHAGLGLSYWSQYERTKEEAVAQQAKASSDEAIRLNGDMPEVREALAATLSKTGETAKAIEELRKAIRMKPDYDAYHRSLGLILLDKGEKDEGIAELKKAIELRPDYWDNHYKLGYAYYRYLERYKDAIREFEWSTKLQPDAAKAFSGLGTAFHRLNDLDSALKNYQAALGIDPTKSTAHANIGMIYYQQKNYAEAVRSYERATELPPVKAVTWRNLGDACRKAGMKLKSRNAYLKAIEISLGELKTNPNNADAMALMALCEAKLGRRDTAISHVREAVRLAPLNSEVLYRKAVVLVLCGQGVEALADIEQAMKQRKSVHEIQTDDDLDSIKTMPEFQALVANKNQR